MPTWSQAKDDGTQGTVGDDEPSEDEIMQSIDDAQAAMDPHDTESGSLDILRLQRFSRKVSTSIVSREIIGLYAHHGGLNLRPLHIGTFHTPTEDDSTPNPSLVLDI